MKIKVKKLISGVIGIVGMFVGIAMLVKSTSVNVTPAGRFGVVIVGYMSVFLATVFFGKAIKKEEKKEPAGSYEKSLGQ